MVGVQSALDGLHLAPFALVVFLHIEYVASLCSRDAAEFVALGLVASGGKEQLVVLVAAKHGGEIRPSRVKDVHLLDGIARALLLDLRSGKRRFQSVAGQLVIGSRVENCLKLFGGLLVVAVLEQQAGVVEMSGQRVLLVANLVAVGSNGFLRRAHLMIGIGHSSGAFASQVALFGRSGGIGALEVDGGIVVFADGQRLLAFLHIMVGSAGGEEQTQ